MATVTAKRGSRLLGRLGVVARASLAWSASAGRRSRPAEPRRILVAHDLLLGDTLMLTPLVAKLREMLPSAELVMALPEIYAPLYAGTPYGLRAIGWNSRRSSKSAIWREKAFDLAFVPGDNRYSWLAMALGARWIVAFGGDRPGYKSWPVDELRAYSDIPAAWGDMVAGLLDGPAPSPYRAADWPAPPAAAPALPSGRYVVLHVGASNDLKLWQPARWGRLADELRERGLEPLWSGGGGEEAIVRACDPERRYRSIAGTLSLAQLWHALAGASLLVSPDTGIAHLGRVVGTPTVALFGPGSVTITGAGRFWRHAPYRAVTIDPFPCRDQRVLFKRELAWVRRCARTLAECPHPRCMDAIDVDAVLAACDELEVFEGLAPAHAAHSAGG
jgi:ADP-heptose:LPS heptosyltransferase